jgi:hypothetical protein
MLINRYSKDKKTHYPILSFGERGQFKMLYDRRIRPKSAFLNNKVHIVFNAGAEENPNALGRFLSFLQGAIKMFVCMYLEVSGKGELQSVNACQP